LALSQVSTSGLVWLIYLDIGPCIDDAQEGCVEAAGPKDTDVDSGSKLAAAFDPLDTFQQDPGFDDGIISLIWHGLISRLCR